MIKLLKPVLFCAVLFGAFVSNASPSIPASELLEVAYQQRTQGVTELRKTLNRIEQDGYTLSIQEQDFYIFLTGYADYLEGNVERAIELFNQSQHSHSLRIQILSYLMLTLSYSSVEAGFPKAFEYLFLALELMPKPSEPEVMASVYTVAATMHQLIYQYEQVRYYANEGLNIAPSTKWRCMFGGFLVQVESETDEEMLTRTLSQCAEANEPLLALNARLWFHEKRVKKQPRRVYQSLQLYLEDAERQGYTLQELSIKALMGEAALYANDYMEADRLLHQSYSNLSQFDDFDLNNRVLTSLALLYQKQNLPTKSAELYRLAYENSQKQRKIDLENSLAYQVAKTNALKEQQKAEALEVELQLSQAEGEAQKLYVAIMFLVAVVVTVSGTSVGWFLYHRGVRFKNLSITDSLTDAFNRRHFSNTLHALLKKPNGAIHSLIIFDLDWFKKINDSYGHAAGDLVLVEVCKAARRQGRRMDLLARIGGEEFAIILKECPLIQAGLIAEQIREAIEKMNFDKHYPGLSVTVSLGVCSSDLADGQFDRLLKQADQALYQSKERGRNLVTLYVPEQS